MMGGHILQIQRKNRQRPNSRVSLEDFDWLESEPIDLHQVLQNPQASLYCLEPQTQQLIFVEVSPDADLTAAPFYYQAQYAAAQRLFALPLTDFYPVVDTLVQAIPQPLVLIYSVGRCGSTLLSRVFAQLEGVLSLSEPDIFSQLVEIRNADRSRDAEMVPLLQLCLALVSRSPASPSPLTSTPKGCVIKPRSFGIELADLIHQSIPQTKALFLYRHAEAVVKSSIRAYTELAQRQSLIQQNPQPFSYLIPLLKDYVQWIDFNDPNAIDLYTTMWLSVMDRYVQLCNQGLPTAALRYEDLIAHPQVIVRQMFDYCGFAVSAAEVEQACQVLQQDSQAGSNLSQANTSSPERLEKLLDSQAIHTKVMQLLSHHPQIQSPDFVPTACLHLAPSCS